MNTRQLHTDLAALKAHRLRARPHEADFAHITAIDELKYRLEMVNRAFTKPLLVGGGGIWRSAFPEAAQIDDAVVLDTEPGTRDLVIHPMSLHWSNDVVGQLIQARNALVPDGLFIGCMFGGSTLHELRSALSEAEVALTGGLSPRVAMMAEIRDLGQLLQRAGFALPVADKIELKASYASVFHLAHDLRRMGETSALAMRQRKFESRRLFELADEIYRNNFPAPDGRIVATFELVFLTGWSPHESQQRPLRPGSAQARLADALKTDEFALPERSTPSKGEIP